MPLNSVSGNSLISQTTGVGSLNDTNKAENVEKPKEAGAAGVAVENMLQTLDVNGDDVAPQNVALKEQIEQINKQIRDYEDQINQLQEEQDMISADMLNPDADFVSLSNAFSAISQQKTALYGNINTGLNKILDIRLAMEQNNAARAEALANSGTYASGTGALDVKDNWKNFDVSSGDISKGASSLGVAAAQIGLSYVGKVNSDAAGNKLFSNGKSQAWCADFTTWVTKEAYRQAGKQVPAGFGSSAVSNLRSWGEKNGMYTETSTMSASARANFIAQNVKPGDIFIQKRNGVSHTGIVVKVYPDGSFETVEGNTSDSVRRRSYPANHNKLSGFISMP